MKVPLQKLPGHRSFELSVEYIDSLTKGLPMRTILGKDAGEAGQASAEVDFYVNEEQIIGTGQLEGWVELGCSRCLSNLRCTLSESITACFIPKAKLPSEEEAELDDEFTSDSEDTYGYEDDEIDMEPVLRERILLAIPYAPLCSEDCLGLCTVCGGNRNNSECGCDRKVIDPRLAALRNIKV